MGVNRGIGLVMAILALGLAGPAGAQESLDAGKTGAQLFASDCALCHKSPQSLAKSGGLFGLSGFLKQHYTASQETANVVAKYLESFGNVPSVPAKRAGPTKRTAKGDDKSKPDMPKPGEGKSRKPADAKTSEPKSGKAKPVEPKSNEPKSSETKSSETKSTRKSSETKSSETKPAEAKPAEPKTSEPKTSEPKPEAKPDKPEKSD